jgi:hypothetical protein
MPLRQRLDRRVDSDRRDHLVGQAGEGQVDQIRRLVGLREPEQRVGDREVRADAVAV